MLPDNATHPLAARGLPPTWQPDSLALACFAHALNEQLVGARLQKIQHLTPKEWAITLFQPKEKTTPLDDAHLANRLFVSVDKQHPVVGLYTAQSIQALTLPTFTKPTNDCMLLRKHLQHGRITHIATLTGERALGISVENANELGQPMRWQWILELMGRYSTWWLVEADTQTIIGGAHRVTEAMSALRPLAIGDTYEPPPPPAGKPWLGQYSPQGLCDAMAQHPSELHLGDRLLLSGYGLNRGSAHALTEALTENQTTPASNLSFSQRVVRAVTQPELGHWQAYLNPNHPTQLGLQWLDTPLPEGNAAWVEVLSSWHQAKRHQQQTNALTAQCFQALQRETQRLHKRIETQQPSEPAERIAEWELQGHALMTEASQHGYDATPDAPVVTLMHPHTAEAFEVAVDPLLTWRDNAQRAYTQVKKARQQKEQWLLAQAQLHEREAQLAQWHWECSQVVTLDEARSLLKLFQESGLIKPTQAFKNAGRPSHKGAKAAFTKKKSAGHPKKQAAVAFSAEDVAGLTRWVNPEGVTFWLGRQGEANAALLSKIARHNDIWCHAWNQPGAHVVIQCSLSQCTEDTLLDGLMLAAKHSQQGSSPQSTTATKLDVIYTECRHVRSVPGSYPGHVTYKQEQTALIAVDAQRLTQRLTAVV